MDVRHRSGKTDAAAEEPRRKEEKTDGTSISRRKLLVSAGMAGAAALLSGAVGGANGLVRQPVGSSVYGGVDGEGAATDGLAAADCVVAVTVAELRAMTAPGLDTVYLITDKGQEGHFAYDPNDTTSADNTGTVLLTASGARFKRMLESPYWSVKWFGAKGDGSTDDTAAIQKAIDTASAFGGGTAFFPEGTYIVAPSGGFKINLRSNVDLLGEGAGTIIKVKNNAGDYGMIFGSSNSGVPLQNVRISNLRIDQNPQNNLTCNIDPNRTNDSNYWQFVVALYNYENIVIDNVAFDPTCGVNTITLNNEQGKKATITNCRFHFVKANGHPEYDNSAVYLNGQNHTVSNCLFYAAPGQKARGAIETHGGQSVVSNNVSDGYYTGVNVQANGASTAHADITVTGNTFSNANQGIQLWPMNANPLKNVTISGNTIHLANTVHLRNTTTGISSAGGPAETGAFENITITGNTIVFQEELAYRSSLNESAYGIGLVKENDVTNVVISGNMIRNAPVSGIRIGSNSKAGASRNIQITGNAIINAGHYPSPSELYRCGILLRSTVSGAVVSGNFVSDTFDNAQGLFSIRVNDFDGTFINVSVTNNFIAAKQGGLWFSVSPSVTTDPPPVKASATSPPASGTYIQGEIVMYTGLSVTSGQSPAGFKVTATGTAGTLVGVTATGSIQTPTITVNDSSQLKPEQWIRIQTGNQLRRIVRISGNQVRLNANLTVDVPTASPVSFAAPTFVPFGTVGKLPGIANTSGSTLGQLENEVNLMKQLMRDYGIMT
ncbi:glycosyl hydrolase family 28-related protein [Paenibacillus sp. GYB003]|uniref:glycosyl hydrolase family 28-related protein n=1 Tax=Paenibacillus sp. GYB003 TaxID=2994392 RepID=UPI002F961ACD